MPTKAEQAAAEELLQVPATKDTEVLRGRRLEVKDILNSNLLAPEARKRYEQYYAELGEALERAAKAAKQ